MDPTSISEMERQEHEALAALADEFPEAEIVTPGCDHRYAVQVIVRVDKDMTDDGKFRFRTIWSQWWEYDTLPEVRQRIVWALANR